MELFDPQTEIIALTQETLGRIEAEWNNFMNGKTVDTEIIPDYVLDSWGRSRTAGVEPYKPIRMRPILPVELDGNQKLLNHIKTNERFNKSIEEIVMHLSNFNLFVHYNTCVEDGKIITTRFDNQFNPYDASEAAIGTTSINLAAHLKRLVFIAGAMHYNKTLHSLYCFSKPLMDRDEVLGVLTITGDDIEKHEEMYSFFISLFRIIEKEYESINVEQHIIKTVKRIQSLDARYTFEDIIGQNETLIELIDQGRTIAATDLPVLISGENGTGKELFAQAIHNASARAGKPFVAINCGAISKELVESELFGYEPGAFTGALKMGKKGILEAASGGTVFFDEIDSMPVEAQIKLLRALSSQTITKIGGVRQIPIDVRIVSSTKENLLKNADKGTFREDLYYRIAYFTLEIPPLRDRIEDIPLLVKSFVDQYIKETNHGPISIGADFLQPLKYYFWRGNIRELKNVVLTAIAFLRDQSVLTSALLPEKILKAYFFKYNKEVFSKAQDKLTPVVPIKKQLEVFEELIIGSALKEEKGNITRTAKKLGISTKSLYRKLGKYVAINKEWLKARPQRDSE